MINGQHYTSIFTDASYDHKTKVAGYAVWFRHKDSDPTRLSGSSLDIKDNNHAEALAIQVAIDHFLEKNIDLTDVIVIIQSDCTTALDWFKAKPNPLSSLNPKSVVFRHVKGHQGTVTKRNAVNTWCDRESRHQMRTLRKQVEQI
jgi:ribonuclease HI